MTLTGRCYCGAVTYRSDGDPLWRAQCHCRECQYISGGGPNYFLLLPADGFVYTAGSRRTFTRPDLARRTPRRALSSPAPFAVLFVSGTCPKDSLQPRRSRWLRETEPR